MEEAKGLTCDLCLTFYSQVRITHTSRMQVWQVPLNVSLDY